MNDTLTLALMGVVDLNQFAEAMGHFRALVQSLSTEIAAEGQIEWTIEALDAGSATATVRGTSARAESVSSVVNGYTKVGEALRLGQPIPYSERIKKPAAALVGLLNGKITSLRFETGFAESVVAGRVGAGATAGEPQARYALGAIKGVVETLSRRRGVQFTLYDALFERPITCYLVEGDEEKVQGYWGKRVVVAGVVGRDADGRPFSIRDISSITPAKTSEPGSYQNARGVLKLKPGHTPEGLIRAVRDGQ